MKRLISHFVLVVILAACGGIPLRSMPRLMQLRHELLNANPAEFMVAIQVDARMAPPPNAAPVMQLDIRPREPGAFDAIERKLPMRFNMASAKALGLHTAAANRRWLIYSFPPESQAELSRKEGFFELWSGSVEELLKQANSAN